MAAFVLEKHPAAAFWRVPDFERFGCRAAFFTREGGGDGQAGPFQGLNLGLNTEDDPARVLRLRKQARAAAGLGPLSPIIGLQVHGTHIRTVTAGDAGRGWQERESAPPDTDGLFTRASGLPLAVTVADCLPVLFCADPGVAVAAVHAGWRGLAAGILREAAALFRNQGFPPDRVWAALGPAIGPETFGIRDQALAALGARFPHSLRDPLADGSTGFDLWHAAETDLRSAGLLPEHILTLRESTAAQPARYFSHRRDHGRTGRMLALVQRS